ncbi:WGxxGxxG family protein [Deinococcus hohokamensis]|uniref:WGxxGxxG family protein n=1 Tax=Deinococcus hohokamensis TaxID=309883 RepID=A0ABV9I487_9DEIO
MKQNTKTTLLVLALGFAPLPAFAQDTSTTTDTTQTQDDNDGMDWGWLGLLGLAGLAGMRRKEATVVRQDQTTTRR